MGEQTLHLSSKRSKFSVFLFILVCVYIVLLGSAESISYSRVNDNKEFYNLEKGESFNSIFEDFQLSFVRKILLKIYLKKNRIYIAQAGYYNLKDKSWREFVSSISNGDVAIFKLNIPAGKNLYEIKEIVLNSFLVNDCNDFNCLDDYLGFVEGTLKPDTYYYKYNTSAGDILKKSQDQFLKLAADLWLIKNPDSPLRSLSEAIILSSIVEKEAGNDNEKTIIAGVFLHRLSIGMKLQADPTIIYGLLPEFNGNITKSNLRDKNNIYNTYQIPGLPPTPISTISKSSLEAVILGRQNDYLYFVAKGDGTHKFSKTYKEHQDAVRTYQLN